MVPVLFSSRFLCRPTAFFLLEPWDVGELYIRKAADLPLQLLVGRFPRFVAIGLYFLSEIASPIIFLFIHKHLTLRKWCYTPIQHDFALDPIIPPFDFHFGFFAHLTRRVMWAIDITWRPSSVRKHFNLLLENNWGKWDQTWHGLTMCCYFHYDRLSNMAARGHKTLVITLRPSSDNFSHFNLLLWNPSAKWTETW